MPLIYKFCETCQSRYGTFRSQRKHCSNACRQRAYRNGQAVNKISQPQCCTTDNIEEQLRSLLQALDMVHSTLTTDNVLTSAITPVIGEAKTKVIDEILQELRRYHQTMQNTIPSGEKK
ncbi:hypothetical protein [Pseudomonas syringae]|uniref:hypothetical protein n=1 Tax=Pseudomonas syringae TaxID=317 RepID=UPI001268A59F|nr:hypothetical protein [Pseudomonas syringae]UOF21943.1 hypothetical protein N023_10700 [Pseudomonas syringae CC440]UZA79526.1 hypothetical protein EZZ79_11180 [Pseudomonas syringae]